VDPARATLDVVGRVFARLVAHGLFDRLREMPELNGKIRKFGHRYYGIAVRGGAHAGS
jgi:hypothetical protein